MFSLKEALAMVNEKLGDSDRCLHSLRVGKLMGALALLCAEEQELWYIVGACHDLDYDETKDDWARHGIRISEYLNNRLPEKALKAIASHDHRTGIKSDTLLASALRAADSLDAINQRISFEDLKKLLLQPDIFSALCKELGDRSYLMDNIREFLIKTDMDIKKLISLINDTT